jgi:hypothetical protein
VPRDWDISETLSLDYSGTLMSPPRGILISWQQDDDHGEAYMAADIRQSSGRADQREVYFNHQDKLILYSFMLKRLHSISYILYYL